MDYFVIKHRNIKQLVRHAAVFCFKSFCFGLLILKFSIKLFIRKIQTLVFKCKFVFNCHKLIFSRNKFIFNRLFFGSNFIFCFSLLIQRVFIS